MFLFIRSLLHCWTALQRIQIHLMFLFIFNVPLINSFTLQHSNTSHVPVYPHSACHSPRISSFKYISCSCLSSIISLYGSCFNIQIHLMFLFIGYKSSDVGRKYGFKYISCSCLSQSPLSLPQQYCIQIHLMFLFIIVGGRAGHEVCRFKYISCSCLSRDSVPVRKLPLIQIHLMFLFIEY